MKSSICFEKIKLDLGLFKTAFFLIFYSKIHTLESATFSLLKIIAL